MSGKDFAMTVGDFVQLEDINGEVCVINTAQISIIHKHDESWQVRLMDGHDVGLSEHVAKAFMCRLAGMPVPPEE